MGKPAETVRDPEAQWSALRSRHREIVAALEGALQAELMLSLSELETLERLSVAEAGRLRMSELADCAGLSKSGMTRLVDRLESAGLIKRESCPVDRRGAEAVLTERGRAVLASGQQLRRRVLRTVLA